MIHLSSIDAFDGLFISEELRVNTTVQPNNGEGMISINFPQVRRDNRDHAFAVVRLHCRIHSQFLRDEQAVEGINGGKMNHWTSRRCVSLQERNSTPGMFLLTGGWSAIGLESGRERFQRVSSLEKNTTVFHALTEELTPDNSSEI